MPSTARGNLGEVTSLTTAASTHPTSPTFLTSLPPFRRRPCRTGPPKPPSKTRLRLQFITFSRRHPPRSSQAACARFRLARKNSPLRQFDNAASIVEHAGSILAKLQTLQELLKDAHRVCAAVKNIVIHTNDPASSSFLHPSSPNFTPTIASVPWPGLATHSTVAPPETRLCALPPIKDSKPPFQWITPRPFS
ncbi:hypothetical protein B0H19DRAFT_1380466 [Mycena capillaripes]|nr:hypothetical protein B0H19DRAFT_1380466 [Mycena capillaripes]